jgi:alkanesulfonate monooxygenase SsuD/methylene tetrahydromethanopterin reductase-like flavin-dependent oxidoreductase (luciferase family)
VIFHPSFPPETLMDYARRAETAGFDELWLWDDCFLPGAFTSAAVALTATSHLKVGIGLLPATAYNPLFAAMEITTLARAFPDRFLPGFGHGVGSWMEQIGAAPKSSMKALEETVNAIRKLLEGEMLTVQGEQVRLNQVQMQMTAAYVPPVYVGAMREKSLRLAGRTGDGTLLTGMSSPAYVQWAKTHILAGMTETGRTRHQVVTYLDVKVNPGGSAARAATRRALAARFPWADVHMQTLGIAEDAAALFRTYGKEGAAQRLPDDWVNAFSAAGTPEQAAEAVQRWIQTGVDSIVFQPLNGDLDCLDEYGRYLMPLLRT